VSFHPGFSGGTRLPGHDLKTIRNTIFDCLHRSENGKAFRAALDAAGLMLATGDRRDCFVVVDPSGGHHALNKKLTGLTLAEIRGRLADLDRAPLPDVGQAQRMQRPRLAARERQRASREFSVRQKIASEGSTAPQRRRYHRPTRANG
jgi:transposase